MKIQLIAVMTALALVTSLSMAGTAFAEKPAKLDLKSIADAYKKAIQKARADFVDAVEKSNDDARKAIQKGIPINKINADSKAAVDKARDDLKDAVEKARADAKNSLLKLKASVDARAV